MSPGASRRGISARVARRAPTSAAPASREAHAPWRDPVRPGSSRAGFLPASSASRRPVRPPLRGRWHALRGGPSTGEPPLRGGQFSPLRGFALRSAADRVSPDASRRGLGAGASASHAGDGVPLRGAPPVSGMPPLRGEASGAPPLRGEAAGNRRAAEPGASRRGLGAGLRVLGAGDGVPHNGPHEAHQEGARLRPPGEGRADARHRPRRLQRGGRGGRRGRDPRHARAPRPLRRGAAAGRPGGQPGGARSGRCAASRSSSPPPSRAACTPSATATPSPPRASTSRCTANCTP